MSDTLTTNALDVTATIARLANVSPKVAAKVQQDLDKALAKAERAIERENAKEDVLASVWAERDAFIESIKHNTYTLSSLGTTVDLSGLIQQYIGAYNTVGALDNLKIPSATAMTISIETKRILDNIADEAGFTKADEKKPLFRSDVKGLAYALLLIDRVPETEGWYETTVFNRQGGFLPKQSN